MSEQQTIHLILSDDFALSQPSDDEIALVASMLGELLLLVQQLDDSDGD